MANYKCTVFGGSLFLAPPPICLAVLFIQRIIIIQFRFKGSTTTVSHFNVITIHYRTTTPEQSVSDSNRRRLFRPTKLYKTAAIAFKVHLVCQLIFFFPCMQLLSQSPTEPSSSGGRRSYHPTPLLAFIVVVSYHPQNSFFHLLSCFDSPTPSHSLLLDGYMITPTPPPAIKLSSLNFSLFSSSQDEALCPSYRYAP